MFIKLSSPPTSKEITHVLRSVAAALQVEGANRFRFIAYQKAADSIENASREVFEIWQSGALQQLPGVGGSIAQHLNDIFQTGKSDYLDEIVDKYPAGMFALLPIPGVGPKNSYKLASQLGLTRYHSAISKLEKAAKQGEIAQLDGFTEDGQKRILQNIQEYKSLGDRTLLHIADKIVAELVDYLCKLPSIARVDPLGSIRRRANTVGDIDIAASTTNPAETIAYFLKFPHADHTIEAGDVSAAIMLNDGHRVDLKVQTPPTYGSLLQHFTGSKNHNVALRELANKKGLTLSEKGIAKLGDTDNRQIFSNEEDFYTYLGLQWVPPELREDAGEIEAAMQNQLPTLVTQQDIKGEFHTHSDFAIEPSHDLGLNTIEEMLLKAKELGYEYLGFSEHNPSMAGHEVSRIIELVKTKRELIDQVNEKYEKNTMTKALNSLEIDIRPDGELALPEEALQYLDYAIVSIHSSFQQTKEEATRRVLRALEHPKVKILGHPTGRVINQRSGVSLDWEVLFDFCLKHDKWLDIDGWPERRDLPENEVRQAIKYGVKVVISSDAHQVNHLDMIQYGVATARRGWTQPKDVINTLPLTDLLKLLP